MAAESTHPIKCHNPLESITSGGDLARRDGSRDATMKPKAVITIDELAEYLQVSKSSLYKLAQEGKVPGQKVGKHWRFHKEMIDQ